jgi:hypothetical protein
MNREARALFMLILIVILCSTTIDASSLIDLRLAEIEDVKLMITLPGYDPPTGFDMDSIKDRLFGICSSYLRDVNIIITDSSTRTLVISVKTDKTYKHKTNMIAFLVELHLIEKLRELESTRHVGATTVFKDNLEIIKEEDFETTVYEFVESMMENFCAEVSQAREYSSDLGDG